MDTGTGANFRNLQVCIGKENFEDARDEKYSLSRCGKSCRLRWMNYLRPDLKHGSYSKQEEDLILKLYDELGTKWSTMAEKLPGRSDNEIKNYWHTHLKKRARSNAKQTPVVRQPNEISPENVVSDSPVEQTSENYPLPPEQASGGSVSSTYCDYAVFSGINWAAEESIDSFVSFSQPIENFWTEPFSVDTSFDQCDFLSSSVEGEFIAICRTYIATPENERLLEGKLKAMFNEKRTYTCEFSETICKSFVFSLDQKASHSTLFTGRLGDKITTEIYSKIPCGFTVVNAASQISIGKGLDITKAGTSKQKTIVNVMRRN
ncbi:hypothetical protein RJ640_008117 [Escallonia rubra]|uniref:Uncharacterized protein n=1 Tax=Escallonia rubra TaxID=112253 RepID=A0AA88RUI6_9ASTE|nr:hypothetical protein RJ640_008117 [Escallonia rubra]